MPQQLYDFLSALHEQLKLRQQQADESFRFYLEIVRELGAIFAVDMTQEYWWRHVIPVLNSVMTKFEGVEYGELCAQATGLCQTMAQRDEQITQRDDDVGMQRVRHLDAVLAVLRADNNSVVTVCSQQLALMQQGFNSCDPFDDQMHCVLDMADSSYVTMCVLPPCWTAIIAMVDSHYFPPLFNKFILPTVHHASSFGFCALTPH